MEKRLGKYIKTLQSDSDGKYLLGKFKDYLLEVGITSQLAAHGAE